MSFSRDTLTVILARIKQDIRTAVAAAEPWLKGTFEYVLARILAVSAHAQHGHLDWSYRQLFVTQADDDVFWIRAALYGIFRVAAVKWEGTYQFTGSGTVPISTQLQAQNGLTYVTLEEIIVSTTGMGLIRASAAGAASNLTAGAPLTLTTPIVGVDSAGAVVAKTVTGTDIETRAAAQARLIEYWRNPVLGGSEADYVRWCLEVSGFTRAWAYVDADGAGTIVVAGVRDNESPIVPDAGERATLLAYVQGKAPAPVTVTVRTLTELSVDFTIALEPDTAEVRASVEEELAEVLQTYGDPGASIALSVLDEAISSAAGEVSHVMSVPAAPVAPTITEVPVLGTVTWV